MNRYWSDKLDLLTPYEAGEQPQDKLYIKLNTNENPYAPSESVLNAIRAVTADQLRLYPDAKSYKLREVIAKSYSINIDNVFVGNGSDEILGLAFQAFFKKRNRICFPDITYSFYPVYCRLFDIDYQTFPLTDLFEIKVQLIQDNNSGVVIANPNAPTGLSLECSQIEEILETHSNSVVLVDEAYVDFGAESCVQLIKKYPNLVVVQTLSKSRSLAGLRVGLAIADVELIQGINKVKNSFNAYPLDCLAIAGATAAFNDMDTFLKNNQQVIETREWTSKELKKLSFYVIPSKSNFLLVQHKDFLAKNLYLKLKDEGILIRHFEMPRINNFIRVTIGTKSEMQTFIKTLQKIIA